MTSSKLTKLLFEVGLRLDRKDIALTFNLFDSKQKGVITIEEFTEVLSLTDYELDLAVEKIRVNLLKNCSSSVDKSVHGSGKGSRLRAAAALALGKANSGVLGSGLGSSQSNIGKNLILENYTLYKVFQHINSKDDGILSLDEIMDLATKVEVFLTEEEARKVLRMIDVDRDDRVEESDFIAFMRQDSQALINKAFRVRESAATLRRWLVRGTASGVGISSSSSAAVAASNLQWKQFKLKYERLSRRRFPGYLDAQVLMITMATLGTRLSALEARELTLLVAPEKNGRIHQSDLHSFMSRECRSFGELIALIERELLRDVIDAYRAHHEAEEATGHEDPDLADYYRKKLLQVKLAVETVHTRQQQQAEEAAAAAAIAITGGHHHEEDDEIDHREGAEDGISSPQQPLSLMKVISQQQQRIISQSHEVISITQLRDGLASYFK